jgi:UDP-N-acetylmuramyl pentapeptide phosphotransferase/UDP-N-acetylglucosamine-1-phosphate transferase
MKGFALWLATLGAGLVAVRVLARGTAGIFASPALLRRNYRDHEVPTAGGLLLVLTLVPVEAARAVLDLAGLGREGASSARALLLLACFAFGLLGLVDDLLGTPQERGFRGHLTALAGGRLTTGSLKLLGGGTVALVLAATAAPVDDWRLVGDACIVALAANLANLLDRAPGRVLKVSLAAYLPLALVAGSSAVGLAVAPLVGAAVGLLGDDLHERLMLGDTGSNVLGAALGTAVAVEVEGVAWALVLGGLVVANLASEVVSFSTVIERVPPLRRLDLLGRRPTSGSGC